jgi:hypothetical protein
MYSCIVIFIWIFMLCIKRRYLRVPKVTIQICVTNGNGNYLVGRQFLAGSPGSEE